jgi:S-adenosylmethionine:tRNA ribosyltransferase-isomerase
MSQVLEFSLPPSLSAKEPPESRAGRRRDGVRLLVLDRQTGEVTHSRFEDLYTFLQAGDLLVFNASRTLPALLSGRIEADDSRVEMRLASHLPDDSWLALVRKTLNGNSAVLEEANSIVSFGPGLSVRLESRHREIPGMWRVRFSEAGSRLVDLIYRFGEPVRYRYVSRPWELGYYQTVYARDPGSAEMPSAGRAFTWEVLLQLRKMGVEMAYITLHAGLSSYLDDELDRRHPGIAEEYFINQQTALKVEAARSAARRVIAVGTTVVRALESAALEDGIVRAGHGYTELLIAPGFPLQVTDGILTGLHESAASHLELLSAFIAPAFLDEAYRGAIRSGYLWHEFGDLNLIVRSQESRSQNSELRIPNS